MAPGDDPRTLLAEGADAMGIPIAAPQIGLLCTYLQELKKWNQRINLTALKTDRGIVEKHFLDSMGGLALIQKDEKARLLDIGTGAGFPGIVLKILRPELSLVLLESSGKKAAFLHHLIGVLKIKNTEIINQRLEKIGAATETSGDLFDYCVSRAVAKPGELLKLSRPFLKAKGAVILYEGRPGRSEGTRLKGWKRKTRLYRLPWSGIEREIGCYSPLRGTP